MKRSGLSRRFACMLYDGLLLAAIFFAATALFLAVMGSATEPPVRYIFQVYLWLVAAVYFIWHWLHGGQTLAMKTWHIRLVDRHGYPISLHQAIRRYLLASLGLIFFGAGFFWVLFDRERLFFHDRFSGTNVALTSP